MRNPTQHNIIFGRLAMIVDGQANPFHKMEMNSIGDGDDDEDDVDDDE